MPGPPQVDYSWFDPNSIRYGIWLDLQNGQFGDATPPGQGGAAVAHPLSRIIRITNNGTEIFSCDLLGNVTWTGSNTGLIAPFLHAAYGGI